MGTNDAALVPEALTSEFLTDCLRTEMENHNIIIESFTTSRVVPPGQNFIGSPIRVHINYKNQAKDDDISFISLIVKPEAIRDVAHTLTPIEPLFYNQFVPKANELINFQIVPRSFFSPIVSTVILEDLKEKGFKMVNKAKMLDLEHCRLYFKAAATLHATSIAVYQNNSSLLETIGKEKLFAEDSVVESLYKNLIRNGMKLLSECVENIDRFKKYSKLVKDTSLILWDLLVEAMKPSAELNTLNQGDPWTPNMMFRYDETGQVCDIRLLDFQLLRFSSPVSDLVFFIWSSATHEVRRNRLQELYHLYVDTFNNTLKELDCKESLSYDQVRREERKLSPLAIYLVAGMPPFNSENSVVSLEPFLSKENEDDEAQKIYRKYYDEHYHSYHAPRYLEQLELVGVFEYLQDCQISK
uniref:CHK kinase-like domain-containing protein n=1 Tax=Graphocephala atropunctata TaxID=36148 RepID=A0A1B6K8N6_9HEMI